MHQQLRANVGRGTPEEGRRDVVANSHGHHPDMHREGSMPQVLPLLGSAAFKCLYSFTTS